MQYGNYIRIDVRNIKPKEKRRNNVRVGKSEENKIIVQVKTVSRDNREKIDGKPNKMYNKFVYKTEETLDVFDAQPSEVVAAVTKGLQAASTVKK